jgi:DnaJ family protein A protein 2
MFGGIPFEHFAGGMPGGMPGGRGPAKDADTTKLYETLGVEKDAPLKVIKKAYRKLSLAHHPDRGGDEDKFKEVSAAYEILSDPDKRKMYDQYGLDGVSDDGPGPGAGMDPFGDIFGGRRSRRAGPKKGPPSNHPLKVSLDDIYNGKTVKMAVQRKAIVGEVKTCQACDGQGSRIEIRQIGPGMIQQMQRACSECGGQGRMAEMKTERKVLEVHIEKGMKNNQKIPFRGMGNDTPGMEAGDINFIVQIKDHSLFKREGADLLITKEISLNQALCGFSFKITHLDGRQILIKTKPGEIIKPESGGAGGRMMPYAKTIPNEGMPSLGNPFVKGNLYIIFRVKFPISNEMTPEQIKVLKEILPDADKDVVYDENEVEEVHMADADLSHFGKGGASHGGSDAYDSDDEQAGGVQCQQS